MDLQWIVKVNDTYINILPGLRSLPPKLSTDIAYHAGGLGNAFAGDHGTSEARSCDSFNSTGRCDSPLHFLENVEDLETFDDSPNLQEDEQEPHNDGQDQEDEQEPNNDGQDQEDEQEPHDDG